MNQVESQHYTQRKAAAHALLCYSDSKTMGMTNSEEESGNW
jgi:hypothetical protein